MRSSRLAALTASVLLLAGAGCPSPAQLWRSVAGGPGGEAVYTFTSKDKSAACPKGYRLVCQNESYSNGSFASKDLTCENIAAADAQFKKDSAGVCGGAAKVSCPHGFWCQLAGDGGSCRPLPKREVSLSNCDPDLPYGADAALMKFLAEPRPDTDTVIVAFRLALGPGARETAAAIFGGFGDRPVVDSLLEPKTPPEFISSMTVTRAELRTLMAAPAVTMLRTIKGDCGPKNGPCDAGFVCVPAADAALPGGCHPLNPKQQQKVDGLTAQTIIAGGPADVWLDVYFVPFADRAAVQKALDAFGFDAGNGVSSLTLAADGSLLAGRFKLAKSRLPGLLDEPLVARAVPLGNEPGPAAAGAGRAGGECGSGPDAACSAGQLCRALPGAAKGACVRNDKVAFADAATAERFHRAGLGNINADLYFNAALSSEEILKELQTIKPDWPQLTDETVAGTARKVIKGAGLIPEDLFKLTALPDVDYVLVNSAM